jgi:hypothetical protein
MVVDQLTEGAVVTGSWEPDGYFAGRLHPCIAVLTGDEKELAAMREVLQGERLSATAN